MKSIEMNVIKAMAKIKGMDSIDEINVFIDGDERKTVIDTASRRIFEIKGLKQGELSGTITQMTSDFKEGFQGTKSETSDIKPQTSDKSYITGEDVVRGLREKGVLI